MFTELVLILGLGFILGLEHALDADHLTALSTLLSQDHTFKKSLTIGIFWGFGHTLTLLVVGLIVLAFKISIPIKMALSFELAVGFMIVVLGIYAIRDVHFFKNKGIFAFTKKKSHNHFHKIFIVGLIHGLAGSAAITLLVLSTVPSLTAGLLYILVFGLGSVVGMALLSILMGFVFFFTQKKVLFFQSKLRYIVGTYSILFGIVFMGKIVFYSGLF